MTLRRVERVQELHELGVVGDLDQHFAQALARIAGEQDPAVLLAAAMASRHVQNGHVCLDLPRLCQTPISVELEGAPSQVQLPPAEALVDALRGSVLCGDRDASTPLYLDGAGRLYLRRYFEHERRLAAAIWSRIPRPPISDGEREAEGVDLAALEAGLDRLFPAASKGEAAPAPSARGTDRKGKSRRAAPPGQLDLFATEPPTAAPAEPEDLQRAAARMVVQRPFAVISGGPGTGKTSTVVKILALLIEQAAAAGRPVPRIALLAPTGKAAARLSESIKGAKAALACSDAVKAAIVEDAATIHRALGTLGGRVNRFRHDRAHPLPVDVVIVDEASMVDLALMARLFDAVPPEARVILLGDKDQLSSVEAGAVLGDICGAGLPGTARAPIAAAIVHLTRSYRYAEGSGIRRLAEAINAADAEAALAVLRDPAIDDVALVEPRAEDAGALPAALLDAAAAGFAPLFEAGGPRERIAALERFRVLCAHRRGRRGLTVANERIEHTLRARGLLHGEGARYDGRPILVTQNDYQARLFNGDVGVLVRDGGIDEAGGSGFRAHFLGAQGDLYSLSAARLPPHESVYAMSVHKSQGSEFDHVAVVLPEEPSPVLSRELLYTAVTRARERVVLHGSAAMVRFAVETAVERASGLRDRLWSGAAPGR